MTPCVQKPVKRYVKLPKTHRTLLCHIALPYFYSKRVKNGGFLVDVEKNLYLCKTQRVEVPLCPGAYWIKKYEEVIKAFE